MLSNGVLLKEENLSLEVFLSRKNPNVKKGSQHPLRLLMDSICDKNSSFNDFCFKKTKFSLEEDMICEVDGDEDLIYTECLADGLEVSILKSLLWPPLERSLSLSTYHKRIILEKDGEIICGIGWFEVKIDPAKPSRDLPLHINIHLIYTKEGYRQKGYLSKLLDFLHSYMEDLGLPVYFSCCTCEASFKFLLRYYDIGLEPKEFYDLVREQHKIIEYVS